MSVKVNAVTDTHNNIFGGHEVLHHVHSGHQPEIDAEAWYQAAYNAGEREERIELLRKCLEINPFHRRANTLWEALAAETATQKNIRFHTRSAVLAGAVKAFLDRGWQLELEMNNIAQLKKRKAMRFKRSLVYAGLFGVIGALLVIYRYFTAGYDHAHLQLSEGGILTVIHRRESREINTLEDLYHIAESVERHLPLPMAVMLGVVSTLVWTLIL